VPKPTQKKRSRSKVAEQRVVAAGVALRRAACLYAAVVELDSSDPRWRRRWLALERAAFPLAEAL